jgi:ketosteroid isomerase-like protein
MPAGNGVPEKSPTIFAEAVAQSLDRRGPDRKEKSMKLCSLGLAAMLITSPVYADEAMTVLQDLGSKWQTAYNNGEPAKFADLYTQDAFFSSGVLGTLKGKPEIEEGDCRPNQEDPKITVHPIAAQQSGNVVWGHGEFVFDDDRVETTITVVNNAGSWYIAACF